MQILFTFVGGRGHAEPLLPVATAAQRAGHDVAVAGKSSVVATIDEFEIFGIGAENDAAQTERTPLVDVDPEREARLLRETVAGTNIRRRMVELTELCARWRPDVIVCDEVDFGAMVVAERFGVPHATVLVTAAGSFVRRELLADVLDTLRLESGLAPDPGFEMISRRLVLSPFPPSFRDPAFPLPATARGLRLYDPGARGEAPTTVYFTLGTIFDLESGDVFERVIGGLGLLSVDVIATIGRRLDPAIVDPLSPNVRVEQYVPQALVLRRCDVVVCHGGSGSVLGALAHGLPLVVLPLGADQPQNADRCAATGAGLVLDAMTATPTDVRDAVTAVLAGPSYRQAAAGFAAEVAGLPGADEAVRRLEQL